MASSRLGVLFLKRKMFVWKKAIAKVESPHGNFFLDSRPLHLHVRVSLIFFRNIMACIFSPSLIKKIRSLDENQNSQKKLPCFKIFSRRRTLVWNEFQAFVTIFEKNRRIKLSYKYLLLLPVFKITLIFRYCFWIQYMYMQWVPLL